jgi:hypothetical protein
LLMSRLDAVGPAPVNLLVVEQLDAAAAAETPEVPDQRVVLQRFKFVGLAARRTNW